MLLITLSVLLLSAPLAAEPDTLEEVLGKHYEAIGGLEKWQGLDSCRLEGLVVMGEGIEAPFVMTYKRPQRSRMEITVNEMTRVQAFDGETAWMVVPFSGSSEPQILDDELIPMMREQSDFSGPLIDWESKGHAVELVGRVASDDGDLWHLGVTLADGGKRDYFVDAQTYLLARIEATTEFMGDEIEVETILSDYKDVDGLTMAHSIWSGPRGAAEGQQLEILGIELDVEVEDEFFAVPETPGAGGSRREE